MTRRPDLGPCAAWVPPAAHEREGKCGRESVRRFEEKEYCARHDPVASAEMLRRNQARFKGGKRVK